MDKKTAIRKRILEIREHLSCEQRETMTLALTKHVVSHPWFREASNLCCYVDVRGEAGTRRILESALASGKRVWIPKVAGKEMEFFQIHGLGELRPGIYGIPEPKAGKPFRMTAGLMIVPGTAFDREGNRIGYGGGYYDRYLSAHPGLWKMGIAFSFQVLEDLPVRNHDVRTDVLITEKGVNQMLLPNDPVMLLSVVNTKIRDYYHTLDALCEDMDIEKQEIVDKLKGIDYEYDESRQQFV